MLNIGIASNTYRRFVIGADGMVRWGPGNGALDINLYRSTSTVLKTDDHFHAHTILSTSGPVTASSGFVSTNGQYSAAASPLGTGGVPAEWYTTPGTTYRLDRVVSSRRFKKNIRPLSIDSELIYALRVVEYEKRKSDYTEIGMVAEEVHKVLPRMVVYDKKGRPESLKFRELNILMLREVQKLRKEVDALKGVA
jgi:hypothetical protein